jgi:chaperonin GroES
MAVKRKTARKKKADDAKARQKARVAYRKAVKKVEKLQIEPLYDRIIARRLEAITETDGGIALPEMAQEKPQEGTVISTGPGRLSPATGEFVSMQVAVGDRILFGKYAGLEIETDDGNLTILREDEILGIIRKGYLKDYGVRGLPTDIAASIKANQGS